MKLSDTSPSHPRPLYYCVTVTVHTLLLSSYVYMHHTPSSQQHILMVCAALPLLLFLLQAVGLGLDYVKLGGLSGAERMTKYNRLISIEEELAQQGILGMFFLLLPCFVCGTEKEKARQSQGERERGSNA